MAKDRLIQRTLVSLNAIRAHALAFEAEHAAQLAAVAPGYRASARNLLHYLSVRQRDIRFLQQDLQSLGLSTLGVIEPHVLASLNAVIGCLEALARTGESDSCIHCSNRVTAAATPPLRARALSGSNSGSPGGVRFIPDVFAFSLLEYNDCRVRASPVFQLSRRTNS